MKSVLLAAVLSLSSLPALAQQNGNVTVVQKAKTDLQAAGVDLSGACGAFRITNLVVWRLRPSYGFLVKQGGNRAIVRADGSCVNGDNPGDGYATDYIIDRATGFGFDILHDGGGENGPGFDGPENDPVFVARNFRSLQNPASAPFEWTSTPGSVTPPTPTPAPVVVDLGPVNTRIDALQEEVNVLRTSLAAATAALQTLQESLSTATASFDSRIGFIETRPTVTGCIAAANLGAFRIPISCKVQ